MDFMNSGISLGRWAGIKVVISWLFVIWAGYGIFNSGQPALMAIIYFVLFGMVLMHEFGHAFACRLMKGNAEHILLWPLGGLAFVAPPPEPWAWIVTTIGGPLVNVLLIPVYYLLYRYAGPQLQFNRHGHDINYYLNEAIYNGMRLNLALLLFNLLPVFPLDGGRLLQSVLWLFIGYPRSLLISGMTGTVGGIAFIGLGLGLAQIFIPLPHFIQPFFGEASYPLGAAPGQPNVMFIGIGAFAAFTSFQTYRQAQTLASYRKR